MLKMAKYLLYKDEYKLYKKAITLLNKIVDDATGDLENQKRIWPIRTKYNRQAQQILKDIEKLYKD